MLCKFEYARYKGTDGFCVYQYRTQDQTVPVEARKHSKCGKDWCQFTAVGYGMPATSAVDVELEGTWQKSKYGLQLNVSAWHEVTPSTTAGLIAFLGSGLIKGVGPETAKAIVARFGMDTIRVLDKEPQRLLQVWGRGLMLPAFCRCRR